MKFIATYLEKRYLTMIKIKIEHYKLKNLKVVFIYISLISNDIIPFLRAQAVVFHLGGTLSLDLCPPPI